MIYTYSSNRRHVPKLEIVPASTHVCATIWLLDNHDEVSTVIKQVNAEISIYTFLGAELRVVSISVPIINFWDNSCIIDISVTIALRKAYALITGERTTGGRLKVAGARRKAFLSHDIGEQVSSTSSEIGRIPSFVKLASMLVGEDGISKRFTGGGRAWY